MLLFGDSLENKEDGLTDIINFLEQKFGVSQLSEIVNKLKTWNLSLQSSSLLEISINLRTNRAQLQLCCQVPEARVAGVEMQC